MANENMNKLQGLSVLESPGIDTTKQTKPYREPSQVITFLYRNWKGEIRERRVIPIEIEFTHDDYHFPDQWLMHAIDMDKGARRTFAFENILSPIRRA